MEVGVVWIGRICSGHRIISPDSAERRVDWRPLIVMFVHTYIPKDSRNRLYEIEHMIRKEHQ